jgi:hypothetical protein
MTSEEERKAHELVGFIVGAVAYPRIARLVRKPVLAAASKLIPRLEGTPANELSIAAQNMEEL